VLLHRSRGQVDALGDLAVRQQLPHQVEDVHLAVGDPGCTQPRRDPPCPGPGRRVPGAAEEVPARCRDTVQPHALEVAGGTGKPGDRVASAVDESCFGDEPQRKRYSSPLGDLRCG
jgi:hypothetical protein